MKSQTSFTFIGRWNSFFNKYPTSPVINGSCVMMRSIRFYLIILLPIAQASQRNQYLFLESEGKTFTFSDTLNLWKHCFWEFDNDERFCKEPLPIIYLMELRIIEFVWISFSNGSAKPICKTFISYPLRFSSSSEFITREWASLAF